MSEKRSAQPSWEQINEAMDNIGVIMQKRANESGKVHCTWYCFCEVGGLCVFVEPPGMFPDRPAVCGKGRPFGPAFFKEYADEHELDF